MHWKVTPPNLLYFIANFASHLTCDHHMLVSFCTAGYRKHNMSRYFLLHTTIPKDEWQEYQYLFYFYLYHSALRPGTLKGGQKQQNSKKKKKKKNRKIKEKHRKNKHQNKQWNRLAKMETEGWLEGLQRIALDDVLREVIPECWSKMRVLGDGYSTKCIKMIHELGKIHQSSPK